jgi:hypothetical protein
VGQRGGKILARGSRSHTPIRVRLALGPAPVAPIQQPLCIASCRRDLRSRCPSSSRRRFGGLGCWGWGRRAALGAAAGLGLVLRCRGLGRRDVSGLVRSPVRLRLGRRSFFPSGSGILGQARQPAPRPRAVRRRALVVSGSAARVRHGPEAQRAAAGAGAMTTGGCGAGVGMISLRNTTASTNPPRTNKPPSHQIHAWTWRLRHSRRQPRARWERAHFVLHHERLFARGRAALSVGCFLLFSDQRIHGHQACVLPWVARSGSWLRRGD